MRKDVSIFKLAAEREQKQACWEWEQAHLKPVPAEAVLRYGKQPAAGEERCGKKWFDASLQVFEHEHVHTGLLRWQIEHQGMQT